VASDSRGAWRPCLVRRSGPDPSSPVLEPDGPVRFLEPLLPGIAVGYSLAKGDRTEWAAAKLTELGVDRIVPLVCDRTIVRPSSDEGRARRASRLERIVREAAMQSRRVHLPLVSRPCTLDELLDEAWLLDETRAAGPGGPAPPVVMADPAGEPPSLGTPVVLVGPEGGWSEREQLLAGSRQVGRVVLGTQLLRVETAAVAAGALFTALRSGAVASLGGGPATESGGSPGRPEHPA
jgi:RsmE family RNA methyltransferase